MATALLFALAIALVGLNSYSTVRLLRSASFGAGQKAAQVALIWLLPIFGALLVLRVLTDEPAAHEEHVEHFEQFEHSDRIGINGEPTPWSGHHDPTL